MRVDITKTLKGDKSIWWIILLLCMWSLVAVLSSTYNLAIREGHGLLHYFSHHLFYMGLGGIVIYGVHMLPLGIFRKFAGLTLVIGIILLLFVFIFPDDLNRTRGAYRWTEIPGFGISLQSSDFAKIALVLYLAKVLDKNNFPTFWNFALRVLLPIVIVCGLILIGNMSTAAILGLSSFFLIFCSAVNWRYIVFTVVGMIFLTGSLYVVGINFPNVMPRFSTAINRTARFSDQSKRDSKSTDFQPEQAKIAVASGGFFGVGAGKSKQVHVLSEAYNDFIFAIIAEEYGIWGSFFVILLYWWLLYRVNVIARKCKRNFPMLLVIGLALLIVCQALIHIGVSVGALPVMGQTLPMVSLGGTSILFMSAAFGIILAVSRAADKQEKSEEEEQEEQNSVKSTDEILEQINVNINN